MRIKEQQCGFRPKVHLAHDLCFDSCQQWISEGEVRTEQACGASPQDTLQASNKLQFYRLPETKLGLVI